MSVQLPSTILSKSPVNDLNQTNTSKKDNSYNDNNENEDNNNNENNNNNDNNINNNNNNNNNINIKESETFQTGVGIVGNTKKSLELPQITDNHLKCPTFFEVQIPEYDPTQLSLPIPVDLEKIKKNAFNGLSKAKLAILVQKDNLKALVDALISDSFWFIVCFFQKDNKNRKNIDNNSLMESADKSKIKIIQKNQIDEILKRISCNYFNFFIRVCDMGPSRKNDPALNAFRDFMSQCVYYSIYLSFPKSRHLFNEEFRSRIVIFFAYLYNGLVTENNYSSLKWELDLGKGNIIETGIKYKDEMPLHLPTLGELQQLIDKKKHENKLIKSLKKNKFNIKKSKNLPKEELNCDILNTPLYRLYAETRKFETLNLLKPIKMSNRKIIDINAVNKQHATFVKFARETLKNVQERKEREKAKNEEEEAKFQAAFQEVKQNDARVKRELNEIKITRAQEYANYCIFISSK